MTTATDDTLTLGEAARALGVPHVKLSRLRDAGRVCRVGVRRGHANLYRLADFAAALAKPNLWARWKALRPPEGCVSCEDAAAALGLTCVAVRDKVADGTLAGESVLLSPCRRKHFANAEAVAELVVQRARDRHRKQVLARLATDGRVDWLDRQAHEVVLYGLLTADDVWVLERRRAKTLSTPKGDDLDRRRAG